MNGAFGDRFPGGVVSASKAAYLSIDATQAITLTTRFVGGTAFQQDIGVYAPRASPTSAVVENNPPRGNDFSVQNAS